MTEDLADGRSLIRPFHSISTRHDLVDSFCFETTSSGLRKKHLKWPDPFLLLVQTAFGYMIYHKIGNQIISHLAVQEENF